MTVREPDRMERERTTRSIKLRWKTEIEFTGGDLGRESRGLYGWGGVRASRGPVGGVSTYPVSGYSTTLGSGSEWSARWCSYSVVQPNDAIRGSGRSGDCNSIRDLNDLPFLFLLPVSLPTFLPASLFTVHGTRYGEKR